VVGSKQVIRSMKVAQEAGEVTCAQDYEGVRPLVFISCRRIAEQAERRRSFAQRTAEEFSPVEDLTRR
jgi:hypothetical protein